ncbi:uncharacterized protein K452DRAFT_167330 [Aplosporella prunicola CBS 121167]|uniref:Rhodopsin domain-containing protein n=1 Tax=Aplosporella prunicola CBS 121167 TaxID=1176127 RepID=A0A6A6BHV4_9PEZI|nr:uncharacterized protein K452DRAFT_167330 [Aplosporella prunicola CBS 121167]KAF2143188.1 hypothetical protein K452DRAFT_167330 [Aplosporella prunicola CBS 121167]
MGSVLILVRWGRRRWLRCFRFVGRFMGLCGLIVCPGYYLGRAELYRHIYVRSDLDGRTIVHLVIGNRFFRLCICCSYLRLTPTLWHIRVLHVVMIITTLYSVFYFFLMLNQCSPISFFWTQFNDHTTGRCLSAPIVIGATCAHNAVSAAGD